MSNETPSASGFESDPAFDQAAQEMQQIKAAGGDVLSSPLLSSWIAERTKDVVSGRSAEGAARIVKYAQAAALIRAGFPEEARALGAEVDGATSAEDDARGHANLKRDLNAYRAEEEAMRPIREHMDRLDGK